MWFRYTMALVAPGLAALLRVPLAPFVGEGAPFLLFFPAVMAVGWLGGFGPAGVATFASVLAVHAWVLPEPERWNFADRQELGRTVVFMFSGLIISALCGTLHRARREVERHAEVLERRVAERTLHLRQALRDMEAFSFSVSHDLRAPLRALKTYSEILLAEGEKLSAEERRRYGERIHASAQRLDRLTADLLAFARLSYAEMPLRPVALRPAVEEAVARLSARERVEIAVAEGQTVLGNEGALQQVLGNLLDNALRFVPPGVTPQVRVAAESEGETVRVSVCDNGIGIASAYHQRIFQMFERLEPHKYPGTGIGLALARRAVEHMQGRIGVESEVGRGSRFWFELKTAREAGG